MALPSSSLISVNREPRSYAVRAALAFLLSLLLLVALSPVYRDLLAGRRDEYRGTSFTNLVGHMEYDRRVLHHFSWGAWLWNPDKALGIPRLDEIQYQPLYPIRLALLAVLPTLTAWHWLDVLHVLLKLAGLSLLGAELGWPLWLVIVAASGATFAEGSLNHFGHVSDLFAAAWLPLQFWLTLKVIGHAGWTRWDSWWVACAALRILGSNPNRPLYHEILILAVVVAFGWGRLGREISKLAARYAVTLLLIAPLLLPALFHFADSARTHFLEFQDWPFRRAYNWQNYWLRLSDLRDVLRPYGIWTALALALALARGWVGPLTSALGGYFLFALLHNIRYAPFWFLMAVLPGVRIPQKAFEPVTWLAILALAEVGFRSLGRPHPRLSRWLMITLLLGALASAIWETAEDPRTGYIDAPWTRELPRRLAAIVRSEPRAQVLLATAPERKGEDSQPLLNSNHNFFLGFPSARYYGSVPTYPFMRATYRVPGLLFIERDPTPIWEWEPLVDLYAEFGIRWVIWDGEGTPVHPRLRYVGEESGFRLYEIRDPRPLIYALPGFRTVERPSEPSEVVSLIYTLPSLGPFCYGCPPGRNTDASAGARLRWDWRPGAVSVDVESPRGAYVVLGETFSGGWRATVDGAPGRIYQANEVFQSVWVPPGRHEVTWRFREPRFFIGLALAGIGLVLCLVLPRIWRRDGA